jgi:pimeloyl-ACP methyl ester carboxylesterase
MLSPVHCTAALLFLLGGAVAAYPQTSLPEPTTGESTLVIHLRGAEAGRMQSNVAKSGSSWVISSTGRFGDVTLNRFEVKYDASWQPASMRLEITQNNKPVLITTSFGLTTAVNEITQNGTTTSKTDQVSAGTVVLPNNFYASYEALAVRLAASAPGDEIPVYVAPQAEVKITVKGMTEETIKTPAGTVVLRKYSVVFQNIGASVDATIAIDEHNRFARLEIPAASLSVSRDDLTGVAVRRETMRNPTDADVLIPVNGFTLAGTITTPPGEGKLRHPAIVLVGGSGPVDRDETVVGIPIFGQLAGGLAERGFIVVRYDKRGVGQSGGRTETATLSDYADDVIGVVKWLSDRDDVDSDSITVVGHSEGGSVAMIAATREKKIDALVLIAAIGSTGAELILEQQRHQLDLLKTAEPERQQKIDLQRKVQAAVVSGKGWEGIPPELRKQADTPWFRSLLEFDPAKVMPKIKQPILIIQGDLDTQVAPENAEQLAKLAHARKNAPPVETVHLPGINHLLVEAGTGEVQEYAKLAGKHITPEVATRIAEWLRR